MYPTQAENEGAEERREAYIRDCVARRYQARYDQVWAPSVLCDHLTATNNCRALFAFHQVSFPAAFTDQLKGQSLDRIHAIYEESVGKLDLILAVVNAQSRTSRGLIT